MELRTDRREPRVWKERTQIGVFPMFDGNGGTLAGGADGFYQFSNLGNVVLTGVPDSVAAFHAQKLQPGKEGYMDINPLILAPDTKQGKAVNPSSRPSGLNLSCDLMKRPLSSRSNVLNAGAPERSTENAMFNINPQGLGAMGPTKIRYAKVHPFVVKVEHERNNEVNPGNLRDDLIKASRSSELNVPDAGTGDEGTNNARFNRALNSEEEAGLSYYQKSLIDRQRWKDANRTVTTPSPSSEPLASTEAVGADVSFNQTLYKGTARGMVLTGLSCEEVNSQFERFQVDLLRCQEVISTPVIPPATVLKNLKKKGTPSESIVLDDSCAQAGNAAENALYNLVIKTMALTGLSYDDSMIHAQGYLHQLEMDQDYKNTNRAEFYQRFAEGAAPRCSSSTLTNAAVPQNTKGIGRIAELDQLEHRIEYSRRSRAHQESLAGEIKSLQIDMLAINEAIIEAKGVRERQRELISQYELKRLDKEEYISDTVERSKSILETSLDAEPGWTAYLQLFIKNLGKN